MSSSGAQNKSAQAVQSATVARRELAEREKRVKDIQGRYAKYGERVLQMLMNAGKHDGELRRLVHRVTGRVVNSTDQQHEVLLEYLARYGESLFIREAAPKGAAAPGADRGPRQTVAPPVAAPKESSSRRKVKLPSGEEIEERRAGQERRKGDKRRSRVQMVYNNKRYGGERRKQSDRRKSA